MDLEDPVLGLGGSGSDGDGSSEFSEEEEGESDGVSGSEEEEEEEGRGGRRGRGEARVVKDGDVVGSRARIPLLCSQGVSVKMKRSIRSILVHRVVVLVRCVGRLIIVIHRVRHRVRRRPRAHGGRVGSSCGGPGRPREVPRGCWEGPRGPKGSYSRER